MANPQVLTETAEFFRKRLKQRNIKAKCKSYVACGYQYIRVSVPTFEARFSDDQQREILLIAYACKLTSADHRTLDLDARYYTSEAVFILPA